MVKIRTLPEILERTKKKREAAYKEGYEGITKPKEVKKLNYTEVIKRMREQRGRAMRETSTEQELRWRISILEAAVIDILLDLKERRDEDGKS